MKRRPTLHGSLSLIFSSLFVIAAGILDIRLMGQVAPEANFVSLFNGTNLEGWQGEVDHYEVIDGTLRCKQGEGGVLFTKEAYADFEVRLEFKLPKGGNNGLAIRYPGQGTASVDAMCEIQILDDDDELYRDLDPRQYNGSIYGMVAAKRGHLKPLGEWNTQRVIVIGSSIRVELNGVQIIDADVASVREFKDNREHPGKDRTQGYFGFAGHNDPVAFRNIRIKKIEPWRIAPFSCDITIPVGHRCMGILPQKSKSISDPLFAKGFVLMGKEPPIVYAAFDWCEIRNGAYDECREAIAVAAGTTKDRVLVSSLHQHDAPIFDSGASRLLDEQGLKDELSSRSFFEDLLKRLAIEISNACKVNDRRSIITHIGSSKTRVEKIASNRRFVDGEGRVTFERGSSSGKEARYRDAEEGLVDPFLHTVSFWNGDRCLVELHSYATHPMSFYGKGEVSSDFVGLARKQRQDETPATFQIYASGCSGDVTAGKYNDGSIHSREALIERLKQAMQAASKPTPRTMNPSIELRSAPLTLEFSRDANLSETTLRQNLSDSKVAVEQRILAAMGLSSRQRVASGKPIDLVCLDLDQTEIVLFPGESFVGLQKMAQELSPKIPIVPIGYGECWTGYIPTEEAFAEGFHENWLWVAPGSQQRIRLALKSVLRNTE